MMRQYFVSNQANADLSEIWLYVAQESQDNADKLLNRMYEALQKLADMPGIGHRREELTALRLRFWPVGQYLIIYRPDTDPLEIVRVVSGYRDLASLRPYNAVRCFSPVSGMPL